ncbi:MAG: DUF427 domain-containing protein [Nonomuraea sp.]|nr:DUF427 domain-containing protein [Nonomuraea sp.]
MPELFEVPIEDRVIATHQAVHEFRTEPAHRRVRTFYNGVAVADSAEAVLVMQAKHMPVYYFPAADVRWDLLKASGTVRDGKTLLDLRVGERAARGAGWTLDSLPDHVAFYWKTMDAWFEEDEEVYVHPRDPYHRVDVMHSSRHVVVEMFGQVVAETRRPCLLVETGLPQRWYIPKQDVRMELLVPSQTTSQCPYKGRARYWSVRNDERLMHDVAWSYQFPVPECPKIENLVCFFDEQADAVVVDGVRQERPTTAWSRKPKIT